tara:strand:+ start:414 stop:920 length:507 start_codon:yes stop_codon:yes gene_type:complete
MSVSKTEFKFDVSKLLELYNSIQIPKDNTLDQNQISITSFDGKQLYVDNKFNEDYIRIPEVDLNLFNEHFKNTYLQEVLETINKIYNTTKWRFMRLTTERRAYSYHRDETKRLHIPLLTNDECMFIIDKKLYDMNELGRMYKMDTTKYHTALNLGWTDRVHIVGAINE